VLREPRRRVAAVPYHERVQPDGPDGTEPATEDRRRFVVCGDNPLALRVVNELVTQYAAEVTVIMASAHDGHGPLIAEMAGVTVVEARRLDAGAYARADLATADALALLTQDDAGNIDAALLAEEINPDLRVVIRMFNMGLGDNVRQLLGDCAVLSATMIAAPAFVSAALGDGGPAYVRLPGRTLLVARRQHVRAQDVVCGLAVTEGRDRPDMLPADQNSADMVLAVDDPNTRRHPARRRRRHPLRTMSLLLGRRLRVVLGILAALLLAATVALMVAKHAAWQQAAYEAILTTLAGANPDDRASRMEQIIQTVLTVVSVALVPVLTAALVEVVVKARLALAAGGLTEPLSGHVIVVGLGDVGTRVIRMLHDLGVDVVAIETDERARGVRVARALGIPLIIGDCRQDETLRAASVQTCRTMLVLTTDDVTNLETALLGRGASEELRVVLRLFDGDFADRVQRAFAITASYSVSYLAAPAFAAAMLGRQVTDTISVGRRVLLVAEVPVGARSPLEGLQVADVQHSRESRLLGIRTGRGEQTLWAPPLGRQLVRTDHLIVVATRAGLGHLLARSVADQPLS
jgi:Trk K+ transport system NAD-binding subunit